MFRLIRSLRPLRSQALTRQFSTREELDTLRKSYSVGSSTHLVNCLMLHPVFSRNKGPEKELYLAEEAIGLAKSLDWEVVRGPYWREEDDAILGNVINDDLEQSEVDQMESMNEMGRGRGRKGSSSGKLRIGDYTFSDVFKGTYVGGGAIELDLSSTDEEGDLFDEWKNQLIRKSIAKSSLIKIRNKNNQTFFGKGKITDLGDFIKENEVNVIFINTELTPIQTRNLEKKWNTMLQEAKDKLEDSIKEQEDQEDDETYEMPDYNKIQSVKVFDRFTIILQIFAKRARSRVAKLQIELAFLNFLKTKLVRDGTTFSGLYNIFEGDLLRADEVRLEVVSSKQRGGLGKLAGEGETQLEIERRILTQKESKIKKELLLETEKRTRSGLKRREHTEALPNIALVGYTNAGKSALMNMLTNAGVESEDLLFQTLSTTSKKFKLQGGQMGILLDTIGFISDLPHNLVESFKTTLEEIEEADVVLHVRDITHPNTEDQKETVLQVLKEIGYDESFYTKRMIEVWNKIDLLTEAIEVNIPTDQKIPIVPISAIEGTNCSKLVKVITEKVNQVMKRKKYKIVNSTENHTERLNWLYKYANITDVESFNYDYNPSKGFPQGKITFEVYLDEATYKKYESRFGQPENKKHGNEMPPADWDKNSKSFFERRREQQESSAKKKNQE